MSINTMTISEIYKVSGGNSKPAKITVSNSSSSSSSSSSSYKYSYKYSYQSSSSSSTTTTSYSKPSVTYYVPSTYYVVC